LQRHDRRLPVRELADPERRRLRRLRRVLRADGELCVRRRAALGGFRALTSEEICCSAFANVVSRAWSSLIELACKPCSTSVWARAASRDTAANLAR
jgi:hypothetical protein